MTPKEIIAQLRQMMHAEGWDAVVISGTDPHSSEYLPKRWQARKYVSGFTGSYGTVVVTHDHAGLWTDTRYFIQAVDQLEGTGMELHKLRVPDAVDFPEWLARHLGEGTTVCVDGLCMPLATVEHMQTLFAPKSIQVVSRPDFIDALWPDRPALPDAPAFELGVAYTGRSRADKLAWLRQAIAERGCGSILLSSLDEIAWMLNIRSRDIAHTPVVIAYLWLDAQKAVLYATESKFGDELRAALAADGVELAPYADVVQSIASWPTDTPIYIDGGMLNYALYEKVVEHYGSAVVNATSPVKLEKALKNETEIAGFRRAYHKDGVAQTRFFYWLEQAMQRGERITEIDASDKLISLRREMEGYLDESFAPISAYGRNAALPHYSATPEKCSVLEPRGLYLIDSGAHYLDGSTDITRTVPLGPLTDDEAADYTCVLQGMIALSLASFPRGTRGANLDVLARMPLWKYCRNYGHGTGHGVGHVLCVHEGPQDLRQNLYDQPMLPGMITSCEPGMYCEGHYGIRHENMLLCYEEEQNEYGDWLAFMTLTCTYIDTTPLVEELLTDEEKMFIDCFNSSVYEALAPDLSPEEAAWLKSKTIDRLFEPEEAE
ncbi:MAG: aminopeptidase P family protein [Bacteroidaceae bacterium]|nr:aminopeptidase P family protein [Bacteroidaceae bacterium]